MRQSLRFIGLVLIPRRVSGTIDQLVGRPFPGLLLNLFNRVVVNDVAFLEGREICANPILAVLGLITVITAKKVPAS